MSKSPTPREKNRRQKSSHQAKWSQRKRHRENTKGWRGAKAGRGHSPFGRSGGFWEKGESYTGEDERPGLNVPLCETNFVRAREIETLCPSLSRALLFLSTFESDVVTSPSAGSRQTRDLVRSSLANQILFSSELPHETRADFGNVSPGGRVQPAADGDMKGRGCWSWFASSQGGGL